jgi:hypothetical protein
MNERGKRVDTTFLSLDTAAERGFIHRDYLAHCTRWSHVVKRFYERKNYESARILDVGCGRELPLAKTLYSSRLQPQAYFGVDYGPILDEACAVFHTGKFPLTVFENTDFMDIALSDIGGVPVTHITCFEVLEHVEPEHCVRMLRHMLGLLSPVGTAFISTPNWNVTDCAANHVNEMRYHTLGRVIEACGFTIQNVYGTFASIRDYQYKLSPVEHELFVKLREYYDSNFLACIFAPLYPAESRNCLWELRPRIPTDSHQFKELESVPKPWSSSQDWEKFRMVEVPA